VVVIEFASIEKAQEYYNSPEYQEAMSHRKGAGNLQITVVKGV